MKFKATVKTDEGVWVEMPIRAIFLDEHGQAESVLGQTGLRYNEFKLAVASLFNTRNCF